MKNYSFTDLLNGVQPMEEKYTLTLTSATVALVNTDLIQYVPHWCRPASVAVISRRTGRTINFVYAREHNEDNDFWDGYQIAYEPTEECGVRYLYLSDEQI